MAINKREYRKQWLGGLKEHVAGAALGERLAAKHGGKQPMGGDPPPSDVPMHGATAEDETPGAEGEMEPHGETCPHCGSPMKPKAKPHQAGKMDHGLSESDLSMLLAKNG